MAKNVFIFLTFFILISCGNDKSATKNNYPALPRINSTDTSSCERYEADKYSTIDELLKDLYSGTGRKDSFELNLRLGAYYHYKKDFDSSLYYNLRAKELDSLDQKVSFNLSLTYSELNDFEKALHYVNKAINVCEDRWDYLNSKCYILGKLDKCDEAIKVGRISLNLNPENQKIYGNLINCFDKLEQGDSVNKYLDIVDKKYKITGSKRINELRAKYKN